MIQARIKDGEFMRNMAGLVMVFALVAVLVMSAVGLAASQTFINKTGKTVTGIKIEFSKSVRITRHDSVFPDQSPSGRGQEFTFNGGELHNSGRFNISWVSSSAKVTDYEWIKKAQPEQTSQATSPSSNQESGLPDPNTPPILYGDDYPGPDEPLYQPKDDEQIWLTDLDGHADIYDNDSIKINYAPGFDKSQITEIGVYRNGIRMRFLPEIFDVLTNAQMKTFDGNYREHSPASNHTDHAIMGYEYKFEIHTADHVWMFTKTVKSGFRWRPKEIWVQMDGAWMYTIYRLRSSSSLVSDELINFFSKLKKDGFTGISFDIAYYMNSPTDNTVLELPEANNDIIPWKITTPSESEIEAMLKASSEVGLDARVRGYIYISQAYQKEHGFTCSSWIDPANPQKFFDSYAALWLKLVPLLNKYHVKLFTPFVEMDGIEKYPDLIKKMYMTISAQFEGEMGFDEAMNSMLEGISPMQNGRSFLQMVRNFTFWNWKDSKGRPMRIEYSGWTPPIETQKDQRVSVMERNFVEFWKPAVDYNNSTYPEDPQMFGEIGARNADGQSLGPDYYKIPPAQRVFDNQEFSDAWDVFFKGSEELGIKSLNIWVIPLGDKWPVDYPGNNFINIGLRQPESPAYRVITAIIKPDKEHCC